MIIYLATNQKNGKLYIGKTKHTLSKRRRQHETDALSGSTAFFHKALRKYGIDNFAWKVLDHADNEEELTDLERIYIEMFGTAFPAYGYNLTHGGEGLEMPNAQTRRKMSKSHVGKTNPMKGRHYAPVTNKETAPHINICAVCEQEFPTRNHLSAYCPGCKQNYNDRELRKLRKEKDPSVQKPKHLKKYKGGAQFRGAPRPTSFRCRCRNCGVLYQTPTSTRWYCDECNKTKPHPHCLPKEEAKKKWESIPMTDKPCLLCGELMHVKTVTRAYYCATCVSTFSRKWAIELNARQKAGEDISRHIRHRNDPAFLTAKAIKQCTECGELFPAPTCGNKYCPACKERREALVKE